MPTAADRAFCRRVFHERICAGSLVQAALAARRKEAATIGRKFSTGGRMSLRIFGTAGRALGERDARLLLMVLLAVWVSAYAMLNFGLLTNPIEHMFERVLRRIVTSAAGVALCVFMVPPLWHARALPLARRVGIALAISAFAYAAHFLVRIIVFHLYRPLWGPLDFNELLTGLQAAGWMFPLWAAFCMLVFGNARRQIPPDPEPDISGEPQSIWVDHRGWRCKIPLESVLLFEAERDYVRIHTASRQYLIRGRLKHLAADLPDGRYMHVHRAAIVQLAAIEGLRRAGSTWRVRLSSGVEAPVSRPMGKALRAWLARRHSADGARAMA